MESAVGSSSAAVGIDDAGANLDSETTSRKRERECSTSPVVDGIATVIFG
jgi:hypothetical protein